MRVSVDSAFPARNARAPASRLPGGAHREQTRHLVQHDRLEIWSSMVYSGFSASSLLEDHRDVGATELAHFDSYLREQFLAGQSGSEPVRSGIA